MNPVYHTLTAAVRARYITQAYELWNPLTDEREAINGSEITVVTRDMREDNANSPILGGAASFGRQLTVFIDPPVTPPQPDWFLVHAGTNYPIRAIVPWPINQPTYFQLFIEQVAL